MFEEWVDKALGHELVDSELLALFLALDPHGWRYRVPQAKEEPLAREWRPDARYARTGTYAASKARTLVDFAEGNVEVVTALLWADGRLPDPDI